MCLAVPGKIIACENNEAVLDLQGNRIRVSTLLTPEAGVGDWVLAHAGFAISTLSEADALETWQWLKQMAIKPLDENPDSPPVHSVN